MRNNAIKVFIGTEKFDSQGEYKRWCELQLLERAGHISGLQRQIKHPLVIDGKQVLMRSAGCPNGRKASYTPDFIYRDTKTNQLIVEDFKGYDTEVSRLRRGVFEVAYGIQVKVTRAKGRGR